MTDPIKPAPIIAIPNVPVTRVYHCRAWLCRGMVIVQRSGETVRTNYAGDWS